MVLIWIRLSPVGPLGDRRISRKRKKGSPTDETRKSKKKRNGLNAGPTYLFQLYIAGNEPNSVLARGNLTELCEAHLKGRYVIETVNILKNAFVAHKNNVLVTPTLILIKPSPRVTLFGNLSDTRQVLSALRLIGKE